MIVSAVPFMLGPRPLRGSVTYAPEILVRLVLRNPVRVHVLEQVVATKWFQESANAGAIVRRYECTIWQSIGGVG